MFRTPTLLLLSLLGALSLDAPVRAQPFTLGLEDSIAPTPTTDRLAGFSVAIDGPVAIVGGPAARISGTECGAAWVYLRDPISGWSLIDTLFRTTNCTAGDRFGESVAIAEGGEWLFVGIPGAAGGQGQVRVFQRVGVSTTWSIAQDLLASDADPTDRFGTAIAAEGARLVVGAPGYDRVVTDQGGVYVFDRDSGAYGESRILTAPALATTGGLRLGEAVDLDGPRVIGGAPEGYGTGVAGRASIWQVDSGGTWTRQQTWGPGTGTVAVGFGSSVALSGNFAFVGAPDDGNGAVRIFERNTSTGPWPSAFTVLPAPSGTGSDFGAAMVALPGFLIVGRPAASTGSGGLDTGSVHVYTNDGGTFSETGVIGGSLPDRVSDLRLGASVAADSERALVGAPALGSAGRAYFFRIGDVLGTTCSASTSCASGECVDGVCCESACGGGATDCMACSTDAGGTADGSCTPLTASEAAATTCRPTDGDCDVAEVCDPSTMACPSDQVVAAGTECRAGSACDPAETCDGIAPSCPSDVLEADGTSCDEGMVCNGIDTCMAGACVSGTAPDCDDDDACTADACAEPGGCANTPIADCCIVDADCDDSIACTVDRCSGPGGSCTFDDSGCDGDAGVGGTDGGTGTSDGGTMPMDAGARDGGVSDGAVDAGEDEGSGDGGCNVAASGSTAALWPLAALLLWRRRRR